ncbi:MAG: IS21 family transposase, partial [Cyanobacteria bacterium]|nr:IS21 family transposase [Cyanobacteriota bacterium]
MPRERLRMQVIREILRLSLQLGLSANEISRALGVSRAKVQQTLRMAATKNLVWPLPVGMADQELETILFEVPPPPQRQHEDPDWEKIDRELRRKGMTKNLTWIEYREENPNGLSYPQFCKRLRKWQKQRDVVMQQEHKAGDKLFVDFAGQTVWITNRDTGEVTKAHIFVAVLGASNYIYAEACSGEDLRSWIEAHVRVFRFLGGVPKFLVPDNLKAAVTRADRHSPLLNRTYQRLAEHYHCGILPARKKHPRDKAKVEKGVQIVEQKILAPLRNRTFFGLDELNREVGRFLEHLNNEPFQKLSGSRSSWFEDVDRPALQSLPREEFEFEEWSIAVTVPKNYHVTVACHYYSVPYRLAGETVDVRETSN